MECRHLYATSRSGTWLGPRPSRVTSGRSRRFVCDSCVWEEEGQRRARSSVLVCAASTHQAVQPAQGERHRLVAASTLSALPGRRVGEQAVLASRRRPARSLKRLSAPADGALRSRREVGGEPALHEDISAAASTTLERRAGAESHGAKPTREPRRSCATTSRRRRRAGRARLRASSAARRPRKCASHLCTIFGCPGLVHVGGGGRCSKNTSPVN